MIKRKKLLDEKIALYFSELNRDQIFDFQINKFNEVWSRALKDFSFYRQLQLEYNLPNKIHNIHELRSFPVLTKAKILEHEKSISLDLKKYKNVSYVRTGGTSGTTTKFPTNIEQKNIEYANTYLGKAWHEIRPFDKIIHIWGHSHLFGTGLPGKINELKRLFANKLIRTKRLNAYKLDLDTIKEYVNQISAFNPKVIIGYTSSIYFLSKYILENNIDIGLTNLSAIILTTESASDKDISMIKRAFQKKVILEYGMAETGVIAYSNKDNNKCMLFWDSFLGIEDNGELIISTLYDRCLPLINYQTGDILIGINEYKGSILEFLNIKGRTQDILEVYKFNMEEMVKISAVMIVHMLKELPGILSIASKQLGKGFIEIHIYGENLDLSFVKKYLLKKIESEVIKIHEESIKLIQSSKINRTLAGKHLSIIN